MPRANRYFVPGHVWHLTHRCHKREFLLKFSRDRRRWRQWLFEAKKRYRLRVLNYIVTSNHVHLLVLDRGCGEIAQSMQLIAGRTAQEYNRRKARQGAYWEDRYHATAVDTEQYLARCMTYIDLNMVRAGVVNHPSEWDICGYKEIQAPPVRYAVIDQLALKEMLGFKTVEQLRQGCRAWVDEALQSAPSQRIPAWTESLAVGRPTFIEGIVSSLGLKAHSREVIEQEGMHMLREPDVAYIPYFGHKKRALKEQTH